MKVLTIVGARPQFIKAGTVSREFANYKQVREVIVHTGQHYDANMSDVFFREMRIPKPHYYMGIGGSDHGAMTGQMIEKLELICLKEKPDWMLVYGDTNSTLAGAIVASKLNIKVAHVEAGLRSFNMKMPEEINRILTDRVSSKLFCPTQTAKDNLLKEGFNHFDSEIVMSGDVMLDGALFYGNLSKKPQFMEFYTDFILCTIHRAENTNDIQRLKSIFKALEIISAECKIILPLHPRTKKIMEGIGYEAKSTNLKFVDPVGYLEMIWLIKNSNLIMTDSGGLQKEAFFFRKPCITLRDETEWTELVENNFNKLVGARSENIIDTYRNFNWNNDFDKNLYGIGKASSIIATKLLEN